MLFIQLLYFWRFLLSSCHPSPVIQARSHEIFRAADDIYAMETLEALDDITISVCAVAPPKPYCNSPSAIDTRYKSCGFSSVDNSLQYSLTLARNDPRRWGLLVGTKAVGHLAVMASNTADLVELVDGVKTSRRQIKTRDQLMDLRRSFMNCSGTLPSWCPTILQWCV